MCYTCSDRNMPLCLCLNPTYCGSADCGRAPYMPDISHIQPIRAHKLSDRVARFRSPGIGTTAVGHQAATGQRQTHAPCHHAGKEQTKKKRRMLVDNHLVFSNEKAGAVREAPDTSHRAGLQAGPLPHVGFEQCFGERQRGKNRGRESPRNAPPSPGRFVDNLPENARPGLCSFRGLTGPIHQRPATSEPMGTTNGCLSEAGRESGCHAHASMGGTRSLENAPFPRIQLPHGPTIFPCDAAREVIGEQRPPRLL